jgi:hypothetical protein
MKPISELTYKVVAHAAFEEFEYDDCVDWAVEMLQLGYDTPALLLLAGITKPANPFEMPKYVDEALNETGLKKKSGDEAALSYCCYYIKKLLESNDVKYDLITLCRKCYDASRENYVAAFEGLNDDWDLLKDGIYESMYFGSLRLDNVENETKNDAQKWLDEYQKQIDDTLWLK